MILQVLGQAREHAALRYDGGHHSGAELRSAIRLRSLSNGTATSPVGFTAVRGILARVVQQHARCESHPEALVEVHVRTARLTDLDAAVRILAHADAGPDAERNDVDYLRTLLFVPSATVLVAEAERRVVGVGVLSIRPSVRSGPFVGIIDELGLNGAALGTAERRRVADDLVEHLATSAKNKGCTRVEVSEPLASAEPSLWKRLGFASRGRTLGRSIG